MAITKTFRDIHFTVLIPTVSDLPGTALLTSTFRYNKTYENIDTVLDSCYIKDRLGNVYCSEDVNILLGANQNRKFTVEIPHGKQHLFLRDTQVQLKFLCSNNNEISIHYKVEKPDKWILDHIQISVLTENNKVRLYDLLGKSATMSADSKETFSTDMHSTQGRKTDPGDDIVYSTPTTEEYIEALRKEIYFLRQGKGKRYKAVKGQKIHKDKKGNYTYIFEMEAELHLPDDAPVRVEIPGGLHAVGSVLNCEDFQITLVLDRDLNDRINSAYIMVEPWKLLEALTIRMQKLNPVTTPLAIELLEEGPKLATRKDISYISKGQKNVAVHLNQDDIVAVWGPPGTGKTYTMARIALYYITHGKTVLIVSHSNVSVDGVVKKVVEQLDESGKQLLKNGKILRAGYVRDEELANNEYATSYSYTLLRDPKLKRDIEFYLDKKEELKSTGKLHTAAYSDTEKMLHSLRAKVRAQEKYYVSNAKLIGTTISKATVDPMFENRKFDLVMFDEVSMAYVPQVIAAAAMAEEKLQFV